MQKNLKNTLTQIESFFSSEPTINQKAWGLINDFYNLILTFMQEKNISQSDLSKKLGISRPAISQMFRKTPNISVKKMVEIADAIGIELNIYSNQVSSSIPKSYVNKEILVFTLPNVDWTLESFGIYDKQSKTKTGINAKIQLPIKKDLMETYLEQSYN